VQYRKTVQGTSGSEARTVEVRRFRGPWGSLNAKQLLDMGTMQGILVYFFYVYLGVHVMA
jgi:hypothetical protein